MSFIHTIIHLALWEGEIWANDGKVIKCIDCLSPPCDSLLDLVRVSINIHICRTLGRIHMYISSQINPQKNTEEINKIVYADHDKKCSNEDRVCLQMVFECTRCIISNYSLRTALACDEFHDSLNNRAFVILCLIMQQFRSRSAELVGELPPTSLHLRAREGKTQQATAQALPFAKSWSYSVVYHYPWLD